MKDANNSWSHLLSLTRKWPHRSATKCNDELPPPHRSPSLEVRKCREHISSWIALRIENDALQLAHWAQDRNGSTRDQTANRGSQVLRQQHSQSGRIFNHAPVDRWRLASRIPTADDQRGTGGPSDENNSLG